MVTILIFAVALMQAPGKGTVPWKQPQGTTKNKALAELLKLYGMGQERFAAVDQGKAITPEEISLIEQLMYRLASVAPLMIERATKSTPPVEEWQDPTNPHAGKVFEVAGTVLRLVQRKLTDEAQVSFQFKHYYEVRVRTTGGATATVMSRTLPEFFRTKSADGQAVRCHGLFIKTLQREEQLEPLFVARRIAWLPQSSNDEAGITPHLVALAKTGFDVGLLDSMKSRNRTTGISGNERECFYQLLSRIGKSPDELSKVASKPSLGRILLAPQTQQGRVFAFRGNLRRLTRVVVNDPDVQARFGLKEYFQLDVFIPLGKQTIRLGSKKGDPVIRNQFPMTFCVTEVPRKLQEIAERTSADKSTTLNETVRVTAVFFKLWRFDSAFMEKFARKRSDGTSPSQVGPLLIGTRVVRLEPVKTGHNQLTTWIIAGSGAIVLAVVSFVLWRTGRRDKEVDRELARKRFQLDDSQSLDDLDV